MEVKQYATKQPMDHWKIKEEIKKISRDKWKWKHDDPKPIGCSKTALKGKFKAIQSYLRKQEGSQIK